MEPKTMLDIATFIVSLLALIVAILIPKAIMWSQTYSSLLAEYRSSEFDVAVEGVINFFHDECKCDISNIPALYREHFRAEKEFIEKGKNNLRLHVQRRLLSQYYFQLDKCLRTPFLLFERKEILTDFTIAEGNLLKVLYVMNLTVEQSPEIYKDIKTKDRLPKLKHNASKMNKNILHFMKKMEK